MRKLSLETEVIMPLTRLTPGETEAVVGGTTTTPGQVVRWSMMNCPYTPQNVDNWRRRIQQYTNGCPPPPPYSRVGNCTRNNLC